MRRAFSLIELIISIVIIAITFAVIPKIMYVSKKAQSFSIKEDALFNGMALISVVLKLPWDENNINSNDILGVTSGINDCNSTNVGNEPAAFYRVGGFIGSRNCITSNASLTASPILRENISLFNDLDDYYNYNQNTRNPITGVDIYGLAIVVDYVSDNIITYNSLTQSAIVTLSNSVSPNSTNIKRVRLNITYQGSRVSERGDSISSFNYYSSNIGQTYIRERQW